MICDSTLVCCCYEGVFFVKIINGVDRKWKKIDPTFIIFKQSLFNLISCFVS